MTREDLHYIKQSERDRLKNRGKMGKPRDAANHFKNFPTVDSAFVDDFTVLPTFVPTYTLEHLKCCNLEIQGRNETTRALNMNILVLFYS